MELRDRKGALAEHPDHGLAHQSRGADHRDPK
jgi:hypothetical protein